MPWPGFEPMSVRSQRELLTTTWSRQATKACGLQVEKAEGFSLKPEVTCASSTQHTVSITNESWQHDNNKYHVDDPLRISVKLAS